MAKSVVGESDSDTTMSMESVDGTRVQLYRSSHLLMPHRWLAIRRGKVRSSARGCLLSACRPEASLVSQRGGEKIPATMHKTYTRLSSFVEGVYASKEQANQLLRAD